MDDLVQLSESQPGIKKFRPKTERLFADIEHIRNGTHNSWRVRSRDGLVSVFGTAALAEDAAVIADPSNPSKIFCWKLINTTDSFGNRIEFQYLRDRGQDGSHRWDQLYLERIQYVDFDRDGATRFLVSVMFAYEPRPDPFSNYRSGFDIRTRLRCTRIEIRTNAVEDLLVRIYQMVYLDDRVAAGELPIATRPLNSVSLLSQIRMQGHDRGETEQLPPLEFGYTRFDPARRRFQPLTAGGESMPARSLGNEDFELVDLFGNGLPDIVHMNGGLQFWRNLGAGQFDGPESMAEAPAGLHLQDNGVRLGDFNGDGRADLLAAHLGGYFPMQFGGGWRGKDFVAYQHPPTMGLGSSDVRLVDLDGDGVVDALETGTDFTLFMNDPKNGWGNVQHKQRGPIEEFPDVSFSDLRVKIADMNGDGLQDIVFVRQGRVEYWPYFGHGSWGHRVSMENSPIFTGISEPDFDPARVLIGDLDGDGLDDIVYLGTGRITIWINQNGKGWSAPIVISGTPTFTDIDAVRIADMLGSGLQGILWSSDLLAPGENNYQFLDLTGGTKPYLLTEMTNHIGAVTRVEYAPSTEFFRGDFSDPRRRWKTSLPLAVQVVKRVETIDEISKGKVTTEYRYHHGHWDGGERQFRGFGLVEQFDTESFERFNTPGLHGEEVEFGRVGQVQFSTPKLTKTWFHLGALSDTFRDEQEADFTGEYWPEDPPVLERPAETEALLNGLSGRQRADVLRCLHGSVLRTETYALDGSERESRPYTVTEFQYGVREEKRPATGTVQGDRTFFPHIVARRTSQWERGVEPMTRCAFTGDYDSFGQARMETTIAVPRHRDFRSIAGPGEPYLASQIVTDYAQRNTDEVYIVDRVARVRSFEIVNDGNDALLDLQAAIVSGQVRRRIIGQVLNYYDGEAFTGLPDGSIGPHGALVRSETLILTDDILQEVHKTGGAPADLPEIPPYIFSDISPAWTPEYPQEFRDLPSLAGYSFHSGDGRHEPGYFAQTTRCRYDFHSPGGRGRGLITAMRDPLGDESGSRDINIDYDAFEFLPITVTDPVGLTTTATYDPRVLRPVEVIDANGNRNRYAYTPLGLLGHIAVMGKSGEPVGDTDAVPGTRFEYNFLALDDSSSDDREPISVRTIRRVHDVNETDVPPAERNETIETVEYSDGYGRLIQVRTQAEDVIFGNSNFGGDLLPVDESATPGAAVGRPHAAANPPNVVVSGSQLYDNKGRIVEKFEPFFASGFAYSLAVISQLGAKTTMFYDPRGQVIRTVNADRSEQRVIQGVPGTIAAPDLKHPDTFEPTPWEAYTYDANDNAERTHNSGDPSHWNTPSSVVVDALGRLVQLTERNGPNPGKEWFVTRHAYDIRGNLLSVTDALSRIAFRYVYDMADRPLRIESIDTGTRRMFVNAAGNEIERHDAKGALILRAYDVMNRPTRLWARDNAESLVSLRERMEYGDGGKRQQEPVTRNANRAQNRLGKLHRHYDEAGRLTFAGYDFTGHVSERIRQVISNETVLQVFPAAEEDSPNWQIQAFRIDWQPPDGVPLETYAAGLLDAVSYQTSTRYDALGQIKSIHYPQDVESRRREVQPKYNLAGSLERLNVDGQSFIERIAYNAKGQRTFMALKTGIMSRYGYDPKTFRLSRLRTERYVQFAPDGLTYQPASDLFQDLAYRYDLIGNVSIMRDRTPESGIPNTPAGSDVLDRKFTYEPTYRLKSAVGRECDVSPQPPLFNDHPGCADVTRARGYTERYGYDAVGNILDLRHQAAGAVFTRKFSLASGRNQLASLTIGNSVFQYSYDLSGNMTRETTSRHYEWDHSDRMKVFRSQVDTAEPSLHAHYLYDSHGQRVKKLVRKQGGGLEMTVYIDGLLEHHQAIQGTAIQNNNTLHIMDHQTRIATLRVGPALFGDTTPAVKYHLGDHLGSSNVVLSGDGEFINREEYTPYGETSFGGFAKKRYRFSGKERDEENGLYYHGARYYAPWLGRWVNSDPLGQLSGNNPYQYAGQNPVRFTDPNGMEEREFNIMAGISYNFGAQARKLAPFVAGSFRLATPVPGLSTEAGIRFELYGATKLHNIAESAIGGNLSWFVGAGLGKTAGARAGTFSSDFRQFAGSGLGNEGWNISGGIGQTHFFGSFLNTNFNLAQTVGHHYARLGSPAGSFLLNTYNDTFLLGDKNDELETAGGHLTYTHHGEFSTWQMGVGFRNVTDRIAIGANGKRADTGVYNEAGQGMYDTWGPGISEYEFYATGRYQDLAGSDLELRLKLRGPWAKDHSQDPVHNNSNFNLFSGRQHMNSVDVEGTSTILPRLDSPKL